MAYTTLKFALFVAVVMLAYFGFPRKEYRWTVLLAASYYFYLLASFRLVAFLLFTTASTFYGALAISRISEETKALLAEHKKDWDRDQKKQCKNRGGQRKRRYLTLILVLNFGILVFLKYYNLFAGSLNDLLGVFSIPLSAPTLQLMLPLGISFYTFPRTRTSSRASSTVQPIQFRESQ